MAHGNGSSDGFGPSLDPQQREDFDGYNDWARPEPRQRDWKKAVLVVGLGALSWVATYVGMLELIESNMGELPLQHRAIIACAVAMLMIMIIWLLDQLFSPAPLSRKVAYAGGYLFLTLISVGFGFGFYWKVLESRSEATRSAESAVGQVQTAMHAGSTRLEQLNGTLIQLRDLSQSKAEEERTRGTSCPNSRPGDGPRRALRDADAQKFAFAAQFVESRIQSLKTELAAFDADLGKISNDDPATVSKRDGTRNDFMRGLDRKLDIAVAGFNAFRTDPQLLQIRQDLGARSEKTIFPTTKGGSFTCPDPQLQAALRGVVRAIDQLPSLQQPKIAAVEGSEATIEAFRRLTTTLVGLATFDLPPSADDLRAKQREAVRSASTANDKTPVLTSAETVPAGLSKRDYIPLALAIFVDLCLLLVSMGRPMNRFGGLVDKMREAEKGPVIRILSRFNDIHRDAEVRQNFEMFRHVVFDYHGAYYVAVPLDTPYNRVDPRSGHVGHYGASDAQDLQHEAHLLANLFASFEKEKIFTRIYSPLLSTRAIQKLLARQGSKFAGSNAFRLYRFKDGAWSDIILGAVMGAARRVEDEQRRTGRTRTGANHSVNLGAETTDHPISPEFADRTPRNAYAHDADERVMFAHAGARHMPASPAPSADHAPAPPPWQTPSRSASRRYTAQANTGPFEAQRETAAARSQFGNYAAAAQAELAPDNYASPDLADVPEAHQDAQVIALPPRPAAAARRLVGDEPAPPYEAVPSEAENHVETPEPAESVVMPAQTAIVEPSLSVVPPPLPPTPDARPQDGAQVTLTRETATFTLPASEAALPVDVLQMATEHLQRPECATDSHADTVLPAALAQPLIAAPVERDETGANRHDITSFVTAAPRGVDGVGDAFEETELFSAEAFQDFDHDEDTVTRTIAQRLRPENKG